MAGQLLADEQCKRVGERRLGAVLHLGKAALLVALLDTGAEVGRHALHAARADGLDTALLEERRQFLRPDSLVAVVMLSDENDCSLDFTGDGWRLGYSGDNGTSWNMPRAASACETDVHSPCCRPCIAEPGGPPAGCTAIESDPVCSQAMRHD